MLDRDLDLPPDDSGDVIQTHVSTVVFRGDRVYKLKRNLRNDFLDMRDRSARLRACEREIELNRRLAPDVYLGIGELNGEPAVVMQRLPAASRLSTRARLGRDISGDLRQVARVMAAFHTHADRSDLITHAATPRAIHHLWSQNIRTLRRFAPGVVSAEELHEIEVLADRYLAGRSVLFEERIADGRICDGHGDLLADDIFCMPDAPRILDCLEFNDVFRWMDVVADVAFLAMDLERLGKPRAATEFLNAYREYSGDNFPPSLADHYIAYRAVVRAKVACLRYELGDAAAADEARELLRIAFVHLERARPVLTLIGGVPGSGKSTLATAVADSLGWVVIRTDEVRHDVAGIARDARVPSAFATQIYDLPTTIATYQEALDRAGLLLRRGQSVVIDATWADADRRECAAKVAHETHSDLVQLYCTALDTVVESRLTARDHAADASDADVEISGRIASTFDPWPDATTIETGNKLSACVGSAMHVIGTTRGERAAHRIREM